MKKFRISHSDIKALTKCEWRWYYERYMELVPINGFPIVMEVGTFGHFLMEDAFTVVMNGGTKQEAIEALQPRLLTVLQVPEKFNVYKNVVAFIEYFFEQPWRVHAIEDTGFYGIDDFKEFAFTPDLVIEILDGPLKGQLIIVDYKFTGQYWVDREVNMYQQVPKYILYYNKLHGTNIKRGMVVMLNTRASAGGNNLFTTKWIQPTSPRFANLERENNVMVDRIHFLKTYGETFGDDALKEILVHTADEKTCKMCFFADDICPMEFDGRDITKTLKYNYKKNDTYGYNNDEATNGNSSDDANSE